MIEIINNTKFYRTKFPCNITEFQNLMLPKFEATYEQQEGPILCKNGYSAYDSHHIEQWPELQELMNFITEHANIYAKEIDFDPVRIGYAWNNKYPTGGHILPHRHTKHERISITAVFYLKLPENSGDLFVRIPNNDGYDDVKITGSVEGEVFMHRSDLLHWTTPNQSIEEKTVIVTDIIQ